MRLSLLGLALIAAPALAQDMPGMAMPSASAPAEAHDMAGMDSGHGDAMAGMDMGHGGHVHMIKGAYGPYPGTREASGTSWQPDSSVHEGLHLSSGGWAFMLHGTLVGAYTDQSGRRGDDKAFLAGHIMGMASRDLSDRDHIQFRLAVSPDPLMGPQGYPLLLASGETADGRTQLIDRQHPHDLFSEVSVSLSHRLSGDASVFVYAGLPGEPAFGPPAYIHRASIMDDPEAPISHHWLDSTHVSEGVVTVGATWNGVKVEASRFRGREPNQNRYDIETPNLDSTAVRVGWNPVPQLSLQASFAHQKSPEQLSPNEDLERWSASAIHTKPFGDGGYWATTVAWGRRIVLEGGHREDPLDAFILESTVHLDPRWTLFARAERIDNNELLPALGAQQGPTFTVGKVSGGAIRDFKVAAHLKFGVGALVSRSLTPGGLDPAYGGDQTSGMGFVRLKLD
ncbi:hypothetical protein KZX46_15580 [Polymorphobacter sp. PAMC 29334]|uniref:hypothetical protein n=1 Tax=Polymorphobacter sp. PAMC 29334 TaxID=2862331 RepID=UPI001C77F4DD|nr:hypothetical protein [Polymorphobacter sp. PAMC 29334]QYE34192.1 hypothetical protein KZX46_15580 [Polymorphobacter sp. PAMC 29334]